VGGGRNVRLQCQKDPAKPIAVGSENFDAAVSLDKNNSVSSRRLFGAGIDELAGRQDAGGAVAWYGQDRLGSVRSVFDNLGASVGTLSYDGFGGRVSNTGATDEYGFTGRVWDAELGLSLHGVRVYDPVVGRWYGEDRLGFAAGDANLSRYVGNDPGNKVDPSGYAVYIGDKRYTEQEAFAIFNSVFKGDNSASSDLIKEVISGISNIDDPLTRKYNTNYQFAVEVMYRIKTIEYARKLAEMIAKKKMTFVEDAASGKDFETLFLLPKDSKFWESFVFSPPGQQPNQRKIKGIRLKDDSKLAEGLQEFLDLGFSCECKSAVSLLSLYGYLAAVGTLKDPMFGNPSIIIGGSVYDYFIPSKFPNASGLKEGADFIGVLNPGREYRKQIPGDNVYFSVIDGKGVWQGENTLFLGIVNGKNMYFSHPFGVLDEKSLIAKIKDQASASNAVGENIKPENIQVEIRSPTFPRHTALPDVCPTK
jgi:RHS repeat-associated protein